MVEYVAWDGYNRAVSQRTCSAPFGNTFRAGLLFLFGTPSQLFGVEGQMTCSGIYRREARQGLIKGGRHPGDLKTVLKRTWPVEMGPRLLTGHARAVVGHHGTRWSDLATTGRKTVLINFLVNIYRIIYIYIYMYQLAPTDRISVTAGSF
ncbi:hypothetical protein Taro_023411 [Colocasia esculenta]|uniref:Uncharacterized protein n=1 Tax=Colocasia esculenta TaxID=4460 RepID=A0A843V437_COLES|nr:hypothetical protein [Colocasia esculenta]